MGTQIYILYAVQKKDNFNEERPFSLGAHLSRERAEEKMKMMKDADAHFGITDYYYDIGQDQLYE